MKNFDQWAEELAEHIAKKQSQGVVKADDAIDLDVAPAPQPNWVFYEINRASWNYHRDLQQLNAIHKAIANKPGHTGHFAIGEFVEWRPPANAGYAAQPGCLARVLGYHHHGSVYVYVQWSDCISRQNQFHGDYEIGYFVSVPYVVTVIWP